MSSPLRYAAHTVGTLEVPDEIALIFTISGCPLSCPGCHSADLRDADRGRILDAPSFQSLLERYAGLASCVCFLGGEWQADELIDRLQTARRHGYRTCLYTGSTQVDDAIAVHLDFLKLGPYIATLGGLDNPQTNQRFLDLRTGEDLTHRFQNVAERLRPAA